MSDLMERFGLSAGRIWDVLRQDGPSGENTLKRKTGLKNDDLYGGIGWLARENKVRRENQEYGLGDTNLTAEIGSTAGKLWELFSREGEVNISALSKQGEMKRKELFAAIGWLAREDKLESDEGMNRLRLR